MLLQTGTAPLNLRSYGAIQICLLLLLYVYYYYGGSVVEWLAYWTRAQKARVQIACSRDAVG